MIGKYYKTIERDMSTGETVFELALLENCEYAHNGILTCKGIIGVYAYGMPLEVKGEFHTPYFHVTGYCIVSQTERGIRSMLEYLYEDFTEAQTEAIIAKCNNDILNLVREPSILDEALKRSKKKDDIRKTVLKRLKRLYEQEKLTRILLKYNIDINKIEMMYTRDISYEQFKANPYLCCLFHSASVYQADQFAYDENGVLPYTPTRLCGFLMDALLVYRQAGHVCMRPQDILHFINQRLKKSVYPDSRMTMSLLNYCVVLMKNYVSYHIVDDEIYLYENEVWEEEQTVIANLHRLNNSPADLISNPDILEIEKKLNMQYNKKQRDSFRLLETSGVKILTGPPGSGKTATLKGYIEAYKAMYPKRKIQLAATTGRAAQVMTESTGIEAETINKMVDIRPFGGKYQGKNINNPIDADFIICDEISMLGLKLASYLFQAVKSGSLLILVGDEDQLQSVEYGNVLQDLIKSGFIEICRLTEVMRHSGAIIENAQKINTGVQRLTEDQNFHIHNCTENEAVQILLKEIQKEDVQVISPVKNGELGVYNLNKVVQKKKNTRKQLCLKYRQVEYYENDPIIMLETNYDKGYFNGDIGIIKGCDKEGLLVDFDNKIMHIGKNDYHVMMLAYAITAHKSQGSGFSHIHIMLPRQPENMLTRRIFYTAVTRAKTDVHIYNVSDAANYAISNYSEKPRLSLLGRLLKNK